MPHSLGTATFYALIYQQMKEILKENILANEKQLWEQALFVFDSSALLNFYEYSEKTRQEIFNTTFEKLNGRLWIANQSEYEYLKNRERVLQRPKKLYDDLITTHFDVKQFETFKNQFVQLKNRTKKDDKHPHFEEAIFNNLQAQIQAFEEEVQKFENDLKQRIELKKTEIDIVKENDNLKTAVYNYFQITDGYKFGKLMEIVKEGEFRYNNQIPPGYEDVKEKIGLAVYGDLVIWHQIIDLAKSQERPVILIIDDLKIDWCYQNSRDKNVADAPREELIKEFLDSVGQYFWLYSSTQFLQKSKEFLATTITEEVIQEVKQSNRFNFEEQVKTAVQRWAAFNWSDADALIREDEREEVDLILSIDSFQVGIDVKYYPNSRRQSIRSLIEHIHPRFSTKGLFNRFEEILIIVVGETKELAAAIEATRKNFDLTAYQGIDLIVGFLNIEGEFERL